MNKTKDYEILKELCFKMFTATSPKEFLQLQRNIKHKIGMTKTLPLKNQIKMEVWQWMDI